MNIGTVNTGNSNDYSNDKVHQAYAGASKTPNPQNTPTQRTGTHQAQHLRRSERDKRGYRGPGVKTEKKIPYYSNLIVFYVPSEDWSNAYILQGPEPYIDERQLHFDNLNQTQYG